MTRRHVVIYLVLASSACVSKERPADASKSVAPGINDRYATDKGRASAVQIFEGEGREEYQKPAEVVQHMTLKNGS